MKTKLFIVVLLAFLASCTPKQELTQQEKDQIKTELSTFVSNMIKDYESANVEGIMKYYWDSTDFIAINFDGTLSDYQSFKKGIEEQYKTMTSMKIITAREEFRFINKDNVLYVWKGTGEASIKDGGIMAFNESITFGFKKINNEWKVVWQTDSCLPPVVTPAKK
jgi:uncharacterized ubiquitin-like protein YukD